MGRGLLEGRRLTRGEGAYSRGRGLLEGRGLTRGEGAYSRSGGLFKRLYFTLGL